ncbi:MAG: heme o synthase [Phycisphaerae bacterium]
MTDIPYSKDRSLESHQGRMNAFLELTKPRIATLVLGATGLSFAIALPSSEVLRDHWLTWLCAVVGTGLAAGAANALNMYTERGYDAMMPRTADRPLPSGRLSDGEALGFGVVTAGLGFLILAAFVSWLAAGVAFLSLASYVVLYTPLKRVTPMSVFVGAVPGALPVMIGAIAATGECGRIAWMLFGIVYFWQLPHFSAIAWIYREDYEQAGYPVMPLVDSSTRIDLHIMTHMVALIAASLLPVYFRVSGGLYAISAIVLGLGFLFSCLVFMISKTHYNARLMMLTSVVYIPLLFALMLLDKLLLAA